MKAVLNMVARLEDKILDMTATMEEEALYYKLVQVLEDKVRN